MSNSLGKGGPSETNLPSGLGGAKGRYSPQPHVKVPAGTYEEEHGRQGFFGRVSHLYHRHPPTGWLRIEGPLRPRAYYAIEMAESDEGVPDVLLENSDVQIGVARLDHPMKTFVRNADGDE